MISSPIGLTGDFKNVPVIPANLDPKNIHMLIPTGFEDLIEYSLDGYSKNINITILSDKNNDAPIITISENLYNPQKNNCNFPKFLIEQAHKYKTIDYLTDERNRFIFNQNELFYICLQHRLHHFSKFKDVYSNLINNDITEIMNFINYIPTTAYNAIQRDNNTYVLLSIFDKQSKQLKRLNNSYSLGNILKSRAYKPTKAALEPLLATLPIHFSSESMGEKSKYVLHDYTQPLYRSVGYKSYLNEKGQPFVKTLFKPAQNNPARNKTHVTANAERLHNFNPTSHFIQDYLPNFETEQFEPKDHCYRKAICVIHPMLENNKFLYGEVYANKDFVSTKLVVRASVSDQIEEVFVEKGKTYSADKDNRVAVGINIDGDTIYVENCLSATLKNIEVVGTLGVYKFVFDVVRYAGNARIDSNTGLKGVTTCRNNLGTITIPDMNMELKPDLVFGMNSFKAKGNGIILARAALAVELGTYIPKNIHKLLNTWDEEEINRASDSLPDYYYVDALGNKQQVQIGIVYARFTELCHVYKSYDHKKPFSFEAGRVLHSIKDSKLFEEIWSNYVVKEHKDIVIELEKIQLDKRDIFDDKIPVYNLEQMLSKKIFEPKDLILNVKTATESTSKLLDEEWNKGFILNFNSHNGKCIRIPCAKTLKLFCTQTNDKMYMYPSLLIEISKIINFAMTKRMHLLFPNTDSNYAREFTPVLRYYRAIKGLLFSSEDAAVMLVQKLSRPELPGFAFKQVTDYILPDNTCVVMCNETYKKAIKDALGENYQLHELMHGFYGLHNRAPFLWSKQMLPVKIWNQEDFRIYLWSKYQLKLEDYINTKWNNDVLIFSNNVLMNSQSDVDGDHSCVFTPAGEIMQEELRNFHNPHETESQAQWIQDYIAGEFESNDTLIKDGELVKHTYALYDLPMHDVQVNRKQVTSGFSTYLYRAITAKANIGLSTNDGWIFNMLLDIYQSYYERNNGKYKVTETSDEKSMYRLSEEQRDELSFTYTRALQDFVVRGVKHTANGSEDFEILFLKNFWKPENAKDVHRMLTHDLKLPVALAAKMTFIITWAQDTGFLQACSGFLKLYNKGTLPKDEVAEALDRHEEFVQANTYFGMLLEPIYSLRKHAQEYKLASQQKLKYTSEQQSKAEVDPLSLLGF